MNTEEARERRVLEEERKRSPSLFIRASLIDSPEVLESIGIEGVFEDYPIGYIRYLPQDFVVEEISLNKTFCTVGTGPVFEERMSIGKHVSAELVKIDRSTLETKDEIAALLGIPSQSIGWAGIKDKFAITSQKMSFQNISDVHILENVQSDHFFLKNIRRARIPLSNGDLWGNRFLLTIRSQEVLDKKEQERIKQKVNEITQDGFWNFFSLQRFGTPRLNSAIVGRLLFQRKHEEVVRSFLTYISSREIPYFQHIRRRIHEFWGDWVKIKTLLDPFPSQFPSEISMVEYLIQHPSDFLGALRTVPDQIRLWFYAYASYLFNRSLSHLIQKGEVPVILPFITSFESRDWEPYTAFLKEDEVKLPIPIWKDFPFIRFVSRVWPTLQKVDIHDVRFLDKLTVITFSLPKGAYATTLLAHFFQLASNLPIVPGIDTRDIDAKEILGIGSLRETINRFTPVLKRLQEERRVIGNDTNE